MAIIPHKNCFCDSESDILKLSYFLQDSRLNSELKSSNF